MQDQDFDTSKMSITRSSPVHYGFLSSDLLGPRAPKQMDQSEGLGHVAQPTEGTLNDLSAIASGMSGQ